jgi:PKD repeat protein
MLQILSHHRIFLFHTFTRFNCPSGNIVSLTISTSCEYLPRGIIILDKPTVSFSVNSIVCANTSVYFNNTTIAGFTNDCSTVDVYTWDFGDGSAVSRQVNPSHVYTSPGKYTITLNAVTPCGIGQLIQEQSVEPILQPNFTYVKACAGTNTQLVNTRIQACLDLKGFYWEIINYFDNYCGKSPYQWSHKTEQMFFERSGD